jgi:DNA-binding GntR family transcriptional regulator
MLDMRDAAEARTSRPSLVDGAYDALKDAIRNNRFSPGYQGSEQEIATQLGMSRTPVHEAIIRLQEEGLVRVLPRRGVMVCALSPDDMREIYDVIIALETASAELIANKPDVERVLVADALHSINRRMQDALMVDDLAAWAADDEQFHQKLVEKSGNRRLARLFHTVMDQSHRARMITLRLRPKPTESVEQHQAIIEAIREGDALAAGDRAKAHRVTARAALLPLLAQLGMQNL